MMGDKEYPYDLIDVYLHFSSLKQEYVEVAENFLMTVQAVLYPPML